MMSINFEGANIVLGKPSDMTDEQCFSINAEKNIDSQGFPYFLTAWIPNKEDLDALNAGRPLFLKMVGVGFQPVALFTCDENGEGNF